MLPTTILWLLLSAVTQADTQRYNSDLINNNNDVGVLPPVTDSLIDVAIIIDAAELTAVAPTPSYVSQASPSYVTESSPSHVTESAPAIEAAPVVSLLSAPQVPLGGPTIIPISDAPVALPAQPVPAAPTSKSYSITKSSAETTYMGEKAAAASAPAPVKESAPAPAPTITETYMKSATESYAKPTPAAAPGPAAEYKSVTADSSPGLTFPLSDSGFQRVGEYDAAKQSPFTKVADVYPKTLPGNYTTGTPAVAPYLPTSGFISGAYQNPKSGPNPPSSSSAMVSVNAFALIASVSVMMFV